MSAQARVWGLIISLALAAGTPTPVARAEGPTFVPGGCPDPLSASLPPTITADCGDVLVPEDRADLESPTIRVAVAVLRPAAGATRPTPLVYLEGGPGGSPLKLGGLLRDVAAFYGPFVADGREVVLVDQRGIGLSEPALDCPGFAELYRDLYDQRLDTADTTAERLTGTRMRALKVEALAACARDLGEVADLSAYHTVAIADDIADVARALGYDRFDLWGTSYGSRVALVVMRRHPELVRSAILDAPLPLEADLYASTPDSYARALDELFAACAAELACDGAFPDLPGQLLDAVERLDRDPVLTDVRDLSGKRWPLLIDGAMFLEQVFRALYDTSLRPALPGIIADAREGRFDTLLLVTQIDAMRPYFRSWGAYFSVLCHDEVPFSERSDLEAAIAHHPDLAPMFEDFEVGPLPFEVCAAWGAGSADDLENEPVQSDVPTLVTTGQFDPIVPPEWGDALLDDLPASSFFVLPGIGHGASGTACGSELMLAFLDDPTAPVDGTCVRTMAVPPFDVADDAPLPLALVPWRSDALGVAGLMPEGWEEVQPGVFARRHTAADQTAITVLKVPLSTRETVALLSERLGVDGTLEAAATRDTVGRSWTLYQTRTQGFVVDLAVAEVERGALVLVLTSLPDEQSALYADVYLPVMDALESEPAKASGPPA